MSTKCTCGCPDGAGQHLENCETYLRYWEEDSLRLIHLRYAQIVASLPVGERDKVIVDDLIEEVCRFVRSTSEKGMECCISDPRSVIRERLRTESPVVVEGELAGHAG